MGEKAPFRARRAPLLAGGAPYLLRRVPLWAKRAPFCIIRAYLLAGGRPCNRLRCKNKPRAEILGEWRWKLVPLRTGIDFSK